MLIRVFFLSLEALEIERTLLASMVAFKRIRYTAILVENRLKTQDVDGFLLHL